MWNTANVARAGLAGLALVILSVSLAEAEYGRRTTIGKNYQQWSNTLSRNGSDPGDCSDRAIQGCFVLFQAIPQQQPLIVQYVSCFANVSTGGLEYGWIGTQKGGGTGHFPDRFTYLVPVRTTSANGNWWALNSPVMHLLTSGERPYVFLNNSAPAYWSFSCSISGKLQ